VAWVALPEAAGRSLEDASSEELHGSLVPAQGEQAA